LFLDHKLWTRNVRRSIKGLKDSDSSLVPNENLSEILLSSVWALGQVIWTKILPHSQKTWNQQFFFIADS